MAPGNYDNRDQSLTSIAGIDARRRRAYPSIDPRRGCAPRVARAPSRAMTVTGTRKAGPGPKVMAADTLEGDDVVNHAGEKLGKLEHVMIDVPTGRVAYGVLSFGGFLGMGDKLFAIPWHALRLDPSNHRFILDVDKETLKHAPGIRQGSLAVDGR